MMRIGRESFGEHGRKHQPLDSNREAADSEQNVFEGDEPTLNVPEKELKGKKRAWHDLVLGVREQCSAVKEALVAQRAKFNARVNEPVVRSVMQVRDRLNEAKKGLIGRTDATLEKIADTYAEKYLAERNPKTGESPQTVMRKFTRACEAAYQTRSLHAAFELGIRVALKPMEFSAQMAMKQFGADVAVRQADYETTVKKYDAHKGGVKTVEAQATKFANTVRERFEQLGKLHQEMPGDTAEEREAFRQSKIAEGIVHAQEVLQRFTTIDDQAKQRILAELHTHLDTVIFDTHKPSMMRKWEQLTRWYSDDVKSLVTKHIDVYQKKQSRNLALITTASRWMTLGTEIYLIQRGLSAGRALGENYTKELKALPAEKRTMVERMRAFGRATIEGGAQFIGYDRYRELRKMEAGMQSRIDEMVQNLIPQEGEFEIDVIEPAMWEKYGAQLTASGVDREWLYDKLEDIADYEKNRRVALVELIHYRIEGLHRQYMKAATNQVGHMYDQYNTNIAAVNLLAHVDVAVNEGLRIRDAVGATLELMTGNTVEIAIPTTFLETKDNLDEPQYHAVMSIVQDVEHYIDGLRSEQEAAKADAAAATSTAVVEQLSDEPQPLGPEIAPEDMPLPVEVHSIVAGETLWGIANAHLEAYRARESNPEMTVHDVLVMISAENKIGIQDTLHIGQELELAPLTPSMAHVAEWRNELPSQPGLPHTDYAALARQVDSGGAVEGFVAHAGREDLGRLPEGSYTIVVGERYTASGGRMPIHYGDQYTVTVVDQNDIRVAPVDHPDQARSLDQFLVLHQDPIVRVFSNDGEVQMEHEVLHPEQWSQHNQALMHFLQDHPITVEERKGAYCARDVAGRYNLFGHELAADVGMSFRDQNGAVTGVVAHAPLVGTSIEASGGHVSATLIDNFNITDGTVMPFERLSSDDPVYRAEVQTWIHAAGESPLGVASFFYDHTKIQHEIAVNRQYGGDANSHVVLLLGEKDLPFSPHKDMTLEQAMEKQFKMSRDDMDKRGWMFETLGIEVNGTQVTSQADWQQIQVGPADHIVVHDIAINHRYHTDRADTLVELMVNDGGLNPVSVIEPSAELLNDTLAYRGNGGDYAIDTFHQVQKGETLGSVLAAEHYPRDLWTAATFAMKAEGQNPDNLKPGELVALYSPAELRAHIDDIYAVEEHRLTNSETDVVHIIRPGETMDELAGAFFDRSHYSTKEWAQIKDRVANIAGDQKGIATQDVEMPGSEYVESYHMTQYTIAADAEVHFSRDALVRIDERIIETRLSNRVYIPDALPVYTSEGIVMQEVPANIRAAIDRTVDSHPDYGEEMREALALVYVNEGMREQAEKNSVSRIIEDIDKEKIEPALQVVDVVSQLMHSSAGKEFAQEVHSIRDSLIGVSEYAGSREMLKDVAWWIHDTPAARALLDQSIAYAHSGQIRTAVVDYVSSELGHGTSRDLVDAVVGTEVQSLTEKVADKMETVRDVQSAGPLQFRGDNIISEDGSWNMSDTMLGRHFDTQEELTLALRTDVQVNVDAAAAQLYQNRLALETYAHAAGDESVDDPQALLLADVNSYNGGPYKTLLGGLQYEILELAGSNGVSIGLDKATGRGTQETREAFIALCTHLSENGQLPSPLVLTREQIVADANLLGDHTIGFLHSDSYRAVRAAEQAQGVQVQLLPAVEMLAKEQVSYGNYAYLSNRGGAHEVMREYSQQARVALGNSVIPDYSARGATPEEAAVQRG